MEIDLNKDELSHIKTCVKYLLEGSLYGSNEPLTTEECSIALGLGEDGIRNIMRKIDMAMENA